MKCKDCSYAMRGYFKSVSDAYVCIGVKEPFIIDNYPDAECIAYKDSMSNRTNDGVYIEVFAIKNGVRYTAKVIEIKDMANILTNSLMDGIEKMLK